jgi:hypothetical protein
LVAGGFIQEVKEVVDLALQEQQELECVPPPPKKRRVEEDDTEDPTVVSLLLNDKILPRDAVWRVNIRMFHHILRALSLGILVAERYGNKVQSAGSMVTAALRLAAYKEHAEHNTDFESQSMFSTESITRYLPKSVLQILEKKPGGVLPNLHKALVELAKFTNPPVVEEMEGADGHPENASFQISTRKLVQYLQDRIIHQVCASFLHLDLSLLCSLTFFLST